MRAINKILMMFLTINLLLLLVQHRILSIKSINPNLLLIALFALVFSSRKFRLLVFSIIVIFITSFWTTPFWLSQILILSILALVLNGLKRFLTGNPLTDFSLAVIFGTIVFNFFIPIGNTGEFRIQLILGEVFYNLILGIVIWFVIHELGYKKISPSVA